MHANMLLACAALGGVLAIVMTQALRAPARVAPFATALAFDAGIAAFDDAWLVPIAMLVATVAVVVRKLRNERDLLEAEDPAAGSEIFTIRGFIDSCAQRSRRS